jgi:hypothetical protein
MEEGGLYSQLKEEDRALNVMGSFQLKVNSTLFEVSSTAVVRA